MRWWVIQGETAPVPAWIPLHHHQSRIWCCYWCWSPAFVINPDWNCASRFLLAGPYKQPLPTPTVFAIRQLLPKAQTSTKAHCLLLYVPLVFYLLGPLTDSLLFLPQQFCLQKVALFPLLMWQQAVKQRRASKVWLSHKNLCLSWQLCRMDPGRSVVDVMQSQMLKLSCFPC